MKETVSMERVKLETIESLSNRKYTKDEDWVQFLNSVKEHGIIQAPVLRVAEASETGKKSYRVIAGRRRIDAARQLKSEEVLCVIYGGDDPRSDDEIALAENVNRQAMHPLDEAALFFKLECKGLPPKEIAKLYARSPQDIYKRLRLMRLTDNLKEFYRDGKMDIAAAAILAELPEEDQTDFSVEHRSNRFDDEDDIITGGDAASFVQRKQKFKIKKLIPGCKDCKTRTHNTNNDLFAEFDSWDDVCLNPECYRVKWYEAVDKALDEQVKAAGVPTDEKIFFAAGVPAELYAKTSHANFNGTKYEVMKKNMYDFTHEETNRKKDACWRIREYGDGQITVERVGYKEKPKSGCGNGDNIRGYDREVLEAIAADRGAPAADIAKALNGKNLNGSAISDRTSEAIYKKTIERQIKARPRKNYASMFLALFKEECGSFLDEKYFDNETKKYLEDITGEKTLAEATEKLPDCAQDIFHFFLLAIGFDYFVPGLNGLKNQGEGAKMFLRYADLTVGEYKALYLETAKEAAALALDGKKKKGELVKKKPAAPEKADYTKCKICGRSMGQVALSSAPGERGALCGDCRNSGEALTD